MLNSYEPMWLAFFASAALKSTVVLGLAWGVSRLLRNHSAAWRHSVWTAAAAAVLALPFLSLGLPELRLPASVPNVAFRDTVTDGANSSARARAHAQDRVAMVGRPSPPSPWLPDWPLDLAGLWALGAVAMLVQMGWAALGLAHARSAARPYPEDFSHLAGELGIGRTVPVLEGAPGSMPMAIGPLRPAVFLPPDAVHWTAERRRVVMLHELAHVSRGDLATHLVARAALGLYWWNPLAWAAWHGFLKERERAADDLVLAAGARASDYAEHLLAVAQAMCLRPAIGSSAVAMARPSQLEGRLIAILDSNVNRRGIGKAATLALVAAAMLLVAPFAAMRAQNPSDQPLPPDVAATIRAGQAKSNPAITDQAAAAFENFGQYAMAQKLLEASLQVREQIAGQQSEAYGIGLSKLGDLAVRQHQKESAADFYSRAVMAIGERPAAAHPLVSLGVLSLSEKDNSKAQEYFERARIADPSKAGIALTWLGLMQERQSGEVAVAESYYRQALAAETGNPSDTADTMNLLARLLLRQGPSAEGDQLAKDAAKLRQATLAGAKPEAQIGAMEVFRAGGNVTAPTVVEKLEPEYTPMARAAKLQGTVLISIEVGPDGLAHNLRVQRGIGMGLDEKAMEAIRRWKFTPAVKDDRPVTVAATVEINFRLL